ncbi:MAG: hypothetical protein WDW38_005567 [Sanguina aurantia]
MLRIPCSARSGRSQPQVCKAAAPQDPLLLRTARGEEVERTPVWLMRQAGRYMAAFREFSDKYPFRMRSETAEIAVELSLQPYKAFQTDGVIFFSDILTPLPAMGIEFDVIKGKGPLISNPVRSLEHVKALRVLDDPASSLPFIQTTLSTLRSEIDNEATLIGFIGTPWTLAAYSVEGKSDKECRQTKMMMFSAPAVLHSLLEHLTESLITYAGYQIESGAQILMLFDSWAHHLSPEQFAEFSMPYSERIVKALQAKYPGVPVIFHANGGTGKLDLIKHTAANVVGLDWATNMAVARDTLGPNVIVQGNVDPMLLFAPENVIVEAVQRNLIQAGSRGHILNVGHGVPQGTPEQNVALFCEQARQSGKLFARQRELVGSK